MLLEPRAVGTAGVGAQFALKLRLILIWGEVLPNRELGFLQKNGRIIHDFAE